MLSCLPLAAWAGAYAEGRHAPPDKTPDGRMIERGEVLARQRATIDRLIADGVLQ